MNFVYEVERTCFDGQKRERESSREYSRTKLNTLIERSDLILSRQRLYHLVLL